MVAAPRPPHVSLQARNEPVQAVLLRLARQTGASISVAQGVSGWVTVSLRDVTLEQALKAILSPLGDTFRHDGNVYEVDAGAGGAAGSVAPVVLPVTVTTVKRAAAQLRALFPQASIREDARSNALVVLAPPSDVQAMRAVLQGIDVRNPTEPTTEALAVRALRADSVAASLRTSFPHARIAAIGPKQLLVTATAQDLAQVKAALAALDLPAVSPPPVASASEAIRVVQRRPADVARALAGQVPGLRASVSGSTVVVSGPPEAVARAKALVAQIDLPAFNERYTQVYRIRSFDAGSVANLLRRSFRDADISVDASINALAVTATANQHQRIADAVSQLDPPAGSAGAAAGGAPLGDGSTELVTLRSAIPVGQTAGGIDPVGAIVQALQSVTPDVHVVQLGTPGQLALVGPPQSIRVARQFIDKVDNVAPQVVLDTEVLELDESVAKNLGIQLGSTVLGTTFSETSPPADTTGATPRLGRFQALTRTPISFTAQLNLAIANGRGRVLADPRITTLSGRTASIRAGDTISILTTTSGNAGTIATTQVQSFQTGVTLDITPLVDAEGGITVALHPIVNSLIGTNNGVPEISTRDTQTTVHLRDDETLVIGGLIQENETRTTTKIPVVGDIPLLGRAFRNEQVNSSRNELVIVVTPHIIRPGTNALPGPALHAIPTAQPLPTLPPDARLPAAGSRAVPRAEPPPGPAARAETPAAASPAAPATPAPTPSAFASTNVFTFGSAPQNNFAKPTDPVQIFYATLSPTVVANGTSVHVAVVTTTNANAVKLQVGTQQFGLASTGPGKWQATFPFPGGSVSAGQSAVALALVASRSDGASSTIAIPVNIGLPPN